LIASLPTIESVTASVGASGELRYEGSSISGVEIRGRGHLWPDFTPGEFISGRNFLPSETQRAAQVVVLAEPAAEALFGSIDPVGEYVRLSGERFRVIGVFREAPNLFSAIIPPSVTVPVTTAVRRLGANADWY